MLREERAKQFMAFDALKGLTEALKEKEREKLFSQKIERSEEDCALISSAIKKLERGQTVYITFYDKTNYSSLFGQIDKLDHSSRFLIINDKKIFFDDIYNIDYKDSPKTPKRKKEQTEIIKNRTYLCIDMKSFFASVECAELGLNPFETNLVVADGSRGEGTICLAITPKLKSLGVKNRCRLFEIPKHIEYVVVKPRMKKYIEYASKIYGVYLNHIAPEDIHTYSIDESFIDATDYIKNSGLSAREFAKMLINEIAEKVRIPATAGIGSNLYLAKVALDITAKRNREHIGELSELSYRLTLWNHTPLTDFWSIGVGTVNRLKGLGIYDMEGVAKADPTLLYKTFGINAELLIDHANGREPCLIKDIKHYKRKSRSISHSQILPRDYDFSLAKIAIMEMTLKCVHDLISQKLIANGVFVGVGYSKNTIPPTSKSVKLNLATARYTELSKVVSNIYNEIVAPCVPIRKLSLAFTGLVDEGCEGYDFFTDIKAVEKEKQGEKAVVEIKYKFGANAILRGTDLLDGATAIERNKLIGGHNSE